jgi:hypothetical protein
MILRSNWTATSIGEHRGPLTLDAYRAETGLHFSAPIELERFLAYGDWVQRQVAQDVDRRTVARVEHDGDGFRLSFIDGETLRARRVVVAAGIAPFAHRPSAVDGLPAELASHTADHRDLTCFAGRRVLVVGGGQSALESAALLHEAGAEVQIVVRHDHVNWLHGGRYQRKLGRWAPLLYAPTDVGPMGISRLVAAPDLFRRLPRPVQDPLARRSIRPAGAAWLVARLGEVPVRLATAVRGLSPMSSTVRVELSTGEALTVDHVLFGTGYRVDVARYPFLESSLVSRLERVGGYPVLRRGLESSVPGLHIVGAPAARSFGPVMRFVSGGWYAGESVARRITEAGRRKGTADARRVVATRRLA